MSYRYKLVSMGIVLGAILSFHNTYWPWAMLALPLSALLAVVGFRIDTAIARR